MLASCIFNWLIALLISKTKNDTHRRWWLLIGIIANLGLLAIFKYSGMIFHTVNAVGNFNMNLPLIELPIGISFYTFQAMSYTIDVYRKIVNAADNPLTVMLYISFFPQLIAGPIIKYRDIELQIQQRTVQTTAVALGLRRFIVGLTKKVVIADTLALIVDQIFSASTADVTIGAAWLAGIAYALQIYFDFSGYSDMAIGMAKMFGFSFKENFAYPYAADTIKDFWRRWHISLSTWFKEYLYIPLGGNRRGKIRTIFNKYTVFFLCGLWHGANWTFAVWGLCHGTFLMLEEFIPIKRFPRPIRHLYTLLVVIFTFVLFRSESFTQATTMLKKMIGIGGGVESGNWLMMSFFDPMTIFVLIIAIFTMLPTANWLGKLPYIRKTLGIIPASSSYSPATVEPRIWSFVGAFILLTIDILLLAAGGYHPFIYFRF
ncbi:MBOAT family protein [uncultured Arcanobacterium sp.]|uniref:MBOAT family O-acyltransferase n=1 Tax=uncultured Arcanobacterium sp. TaxID=487520 RepID=UPI002630CE5F|nr:MBOAT family O-acyltransferase [uncultured Arcanobacterium sp.]